METKNPPPMMTEKIPTTKPPTRSSAVLDVSSQGAAALIPERSITIHHPDASDGTYHLFAANYYSPRTLIYELLKAFSFVRFRYVDVPLGIGRNIVGAIELTGPVSTASELADSLQ